MNRPDRRTWLDSGRHPLPRFQSVEADAISSGKPVRSKASGGKQLPAACRLESSAFEAGEASRVTGAATRIGSVRQPTSAEMPMLNPARSDCRVLKHWSIRILGTDEVIDRIKVREVYKGCSLGLATFDRRNRRMRTVRQW
jgi:hypothetical protein